MADGEATAELREIVARAIQAEFDRTIAVYDDCLTHDDAVLLADAVLTALAAHGRGVGGGVGLTEEEREACRIGALALEGWLDKVHDRFPADAWRHTTMGQVEAAVPNLRRLAGAGPGLSASEGEDR